MGPVEKHGGQLISRQEIQEFCKSSLHFLCTQMLGFKDWQEGLHDEVENFLDRPSKKKALLLPRGHLKTSLVTIGKSIQHILRNPNVRILIANQVWDKCREMLTVIEQNLDDKSPLPSVFGEFRSGHWNNDAFTIRQRTRAFKEPTLSTTGVEAETTGGHYDVIFLDDLTGLQNCQTPDQREKVKRFRRSMIDLLEPQGTLYEVGTRWHLDDTFSEIEEKEKKYYDVMVRKVIEHGQIIYPRKFNTRFDETKKEWTPVSTPCMDFIDYLKASKTSAEFSAQYLNEPIDEEHQLFKPAYFRYFDRRPERLYVGMTIDPAISEKHGADYFAIDVTGMDEKYDLYKLDYLRGHWNVSDSIEHIFTMYQKWRPSVVALETVAYQKALKAWLEETMRRRGVHFPITELKRNTNESKEFRIKGLEPFYREGKVFHANWMQGKDLEIELLQFPKGKHDDLIDAAASQLDILVPGDSQAADGLPVGCWEQAFQDAQRANQPFISFFHE